MSNNINGTKSEQLGMSFSTANGQLRKNIMFALVQKCELDTCYRCGKKIESVNEFSIEHKMPWLHSENPFELFFDVDNIAFSHCSCNYSERRGWSKTKSKSKYKGVVYDTSKQRNKRWRAGVSINGKSVTVGRYGTPEEAARAYDNKVIELNGNLAVTNKSLGLL